MKLNLLLVGMSGSGKSSTLKSIVRKGDIGVRGGWKTVTDSCQEEEGSFEGWVIKVVDTPSLFSTNIKSMREQDDHFRRAIDETFRRYPNGFHAIVLVLSYGRRFGQEDVQTIKILKSVFGENWLRDRGVVVVTSGDNFHFDVEGTQTTFADWCKSQKGPMGEIFKECNFRCVLFDNVTNDKRSMYSQLSRLISVVNEFRGPPHATAHKYDATSSVKQNSSKSHIAAQKNQELEQLRQKKNSPHVDRGMENYSHTSTSKSNHNMTTSSSERNNCPTCGGANTTWSERGDLMELGDETSPQGLYPNIQEPMYSHNTSSMGSPNETRVRSPDKNKILRFRQDILGVCVELRKYLGVMQKQDWIMHFTSKIDKIRQSLATEVERGYFENSIVSLQWVIPQLGQNRNLGGAQLAYAKTTLEGMIRGVYDTMERDLDSVLTRWEREPQLNT